MGEFELTSKLLGSYEEHIQETLQFLSGQTSTLVDIGAADGYFGVGMVARGLFTKSYCFEIAPKGQKVLLECSQVNDVSQKVFIESKASVESLAELEGVRNGSITILCDIEGAEFNLFNKEMIQLVKNCPLIIELHDSFIPRLRESRLKLATELRAIYSSYRVTRNYFKTSYPELREFPDDIRLLMLSEGRPVDIEWLVCIAKKSQWMAADMNLKNIRSAALTNKTLLVCFCAFLGLHFDGVKAETVVRLDLNGSEVRFDGQEYYGPTYHINFSKPHFFWDGFASINRKFWGTGIEPGVDYSEFQTKQYDLNLGPRQMLYSYYRLDPGQLEFRWMSFGCMDDAGAIDQLFGFGDPGESFWVGFRLEKSGLAKTPYRLAMQVKNFDETTEEVLFLETCPSEAARYVVRRYTDRAIFMINNQVRAVITSEGTKYGLPDIGLEILLSNREGTPANLDLVKYDSY